MNVQIEKRSEDWALGGSEESSKWDWEVTDTKIRTLETGCSKLKEKKKSVPRKRKQILENLSKFPNKLQNDAGKPKLDEDLEKISNVAI